MRQRPTLNIYEWIDCPNPSYPFRIAETNFTIDGPRTRMTDKVFSSLEEAQEFVSQECPPCYCAVKCMAPRVQGKQTACLRGLQPGETINGDGSTR